MGKPPIIRRRVAPFSPVCCSWSTLRSFGPYPSFFLLKGRPLCYNNGVKIVLPALLLISWLSPLAWTDPLPSYSLAIYGWPQRFQLEEVDRWPVQAFEGSQGLVLAPLPGQEVRPGKDPFGGLTFRYSLALYTQSSLEEKGLSSKEGGRKEWFLRYRLYYRKAKYRALALEIGRFILVSHHLIEKKLSLPLFYGESGVANVWLLDTGEAGAEQKGENLFFYQIERPRSSLEWLREIAHELGHLAFPGWSGFREPEGWANGDLGERLLLNWLSQQGNYTFGGRAVSFQPYLKQYYEPILLRFIAGGWDDQQVRKRDRRAFEMTLGLALYIEYAHGAEGLGEVLKGIRKPTPESLLESYAQYLARKQVLLIRLPKQGGWLYVPKSLSIRQASSRDGDLILSWSGAGGQGLYLAYPRSSQKEGKGNTPQASRPTRTLWPKGLRKRFPPGWYKLIPSGGRGGVITLYQQ